MEEKIKEYVKTLSTGEIKELIDNLNKNLVERAVDEYINGLAQVRHKNRME